MLDIFYATKGNLTNKINTSNSYLLYIVTLLNNYKRYVKRQIIVKFPFSKLKFHPKSTSRVRICSTFSLLRPLYFDSRTSNSVLRPFMKSGLLIGREEQVEVQFWSK